MHPTAEFQEGQGGCSATPERLTLLGLHRSVSVSATELPEAILGLAPGMVRTRDRGSQKAPPENPAGASSYHQQ